MDKEHITTLILNDYISIHITKLLLRILLIIVIIYKLLSLLQSPNALYYFSVFR